MILFVHIGCHYVFTVRPDDACLRLWTGLSVVQVMFVGLRRQPITWPKDYVDGLVQDCSNGVTAVLH